LLCKSIAKAPCAVFDGTAWNFSAWAGDGPHAQNFMCRLLLPIIVVRPQRMKFYAPRSFRFFALLAGSVISSKYFLAFFLIF